MRQYSIYILTAMCSLLASCSSDDPLSNGGDGDVTPAFALSTRAEGSTAGEDTYRLLAYSSAGIYLGDTYTGGGRTYSYGTGTYYLPAGGNTLIPCMVDDNGIFVRDMSIDEEDMNNSPAIHGTLGNVLVACVSPAVKNNADGTVSYNPKNPFYCSLAEPVNVTGYGTVKLTEPLLDQRARIIVRIYKGADAPSDFTMPGTITLEGMGGENDRIGFNPVNRAITVPAGSENAFRTFTLTEAAGSTGTGGNTLRYSTEDCFVPAADYSLQGSPQFVVNLGIQREGTDVPVNVSVKITNLDNDSGKIPEFKPETVYTFNIILFSTYYGLSVDIMDWEEPEDDLNADIGAFGTTINFGNFSYGEDEDGWTDVPGEPDYPDIGAQP